MHEDFRDVPVRSLSADGRVELGEIGNEGGACWSVISPHSRGEIELTREGIDGARKAGRLVMVPQVDDNGTTVRLVVGPLNDQEEREWVGKLNGALIVEEDGIVVSGGNSAFNLRDIPEELAEWCVRVPIPAGIYKVTVYSLLPGGNADQQLQKPDNWQSYVEYFEQTRPGEVWPEWLGAMTFFDDKMPESVGHELDERRIDDDEWDEEWLEFILQLEPCDTLPEITDFPTRSIEAFTGRLPSQCPLGIWPE